VHPFFAQRLMRWALLRVGLTFREYFASWWPAGSSVAVMALAVFALDFALPETVRPTIVLGAKILTGAVAYVAAVLTFHRQRVLAFRQLWRSVKK
jgi:hypothetical protein